METPIVRSSCTSRQLRQRGRQYLLYVESLSASEERDMWLYCKNDDITHQRKWYVNSTHTQLIKLKSALTQPTINGNIFDFSALRLRREEFHTIVLYDRLQLTKERLEKMVHNAVPLNHNDIFVKLAYKSITSTVFFRLSQKNYDNIQWCVSVTSVNGKDQYKLESRALLQRVAHQTCRFTLVRINGRFRQETIPPTITAIRAPQQKEHFLRSVRLSNYGAGLYNRLLDPKSITTLTDKYTRTHGLIKK